MKTNKNFKRLLIFAIAAFLMLGAFTLTTSAASCDYEIWLYDSFGDGWNGNVLDVSVDSSIVLDDITLATGSGPAVFAFTVDDGSTIDVDYQNLGSWAYENSYEIYDSTGVLVDSVTVTSPYDDSDWTGTATCSASAGCDYELCLEDTWGDGWNGGTLDVYINSVIYGSYTIISGSGPECHVISVTDGDTIDLDYTYGSFPTENLWDLYDSEGVLVHAGSGGYSDTSYDSTHIASCPPAGPVTDVGVTAINSPVALDDVGAIPVEVEVENFGDVDVVDVPVHVTVSHGTAGGTLITEGFEGSFPPADWQIVNYGSGPTWVQGTYGAHSYEPAGSGSYYADCWYSNGQGHDTGLFTPSFDCGSATTATLEFERNFQDFAGYGYFEVNAYSGGSFEENLLFITNDDIPTSGIHTVLSFDPSVYADPSDVTIEFYYNDDNYAGWGVGIDDVLIETPSSIIYDYDETVLVDLLAGEIATVALPDWTATEAGFFDVIACTELADDLPDNDCVEIMDMPIGNLDVELTDIYVPQTLMGPVPFNPEVTVSNVGDLPAENVPVHAVIEGGLELKFEETFEDLAFNKITDEKIGVFTEQSSEEKDMMVARLNWDNKPMMDVSDWTILDLDGDSQTWHQHSDANEGSYGMYNGDDTLLEYNNNAFDWLISPPIDVGVGGEITVDLKYDTEAYGSSYYDYLFVGNSPDGSSFNGYVFYGDSLGWQDDVTIPLVPTSIAADGTTYICFMFSSDSSVNWYEGAHVDDVKVYGGGTVYDETVYADFDVGESFNVQFPECDIPDIGTYTIEVCTELAEDENAANDCDDLTFSNDAPVYILETGWGYPTIQDGIDAALPGQTVVATDGAYVEDIVINKDITVTGENPPTNTAVINGIVSITADGATFMNFKVQPLTVFDTHEAAVTVGANDVTVKDNIITGVRGLVTDTTGMFTIKGIHVYGGSTAYTGIDIINNTVTDILNEGSSGGGVPGAIYSSDFETDDGGWIPGTVVGDWEWTNTYDVANYDPSGSTYTQTPPPAANSGTGLWGTNVYGPYTNSGGETILSQTFDFSGETGVEMTFWTWEDAFGTWDYCELFANGDLVYTTTDSTTPTVWEEVTVDLSAYDGLSSVELVFSMHASTVVNYAGWYIDDIVISSDSLGGRDEYYGGATGIMIQGNLEDIEVLNNVITDIHSAGWCYGLEITQTNIPPDYPAPTMVVAEGNYFSGIGDGTVYEEVSLNEAPYFGHMVTIEGGADATEVDLHNNIFDPDCHAPVYAIINKDTEGILDATQNWFGYPDGPSGGIADAVDGTIADGMGCIINELGDVHFAPWIGVNAVATVNTEVAETGEAIIFNGEDSWYNEYVPIDDGGGSGCAYEVCLIDTWGDGWDVGYGGPNYLDVYVDGILVLDDITLNSGTGPECYEFMVEDGSLIETDYQGFGSYQGENEYIIYDSEGNQVAYEGGGGAIPGDWSGTATCPEEEEEEEEFPGMSEPIYHWKFDDGTYSNVANPTHAYTAAGTYNVYLRVQGDNFHPHWSNMMFDWAYFTIEVYSPGAPLSANADGSGLGEYVYVLGEPVELFGSASGGTPPYTYQWDLGNGQTVTEQNPVCEYGQEGTYTVTLTVTDGELNTATDEAQVIIQGVDEVNVRLPTSIDSAPGAVVVFNPTVSGGQAPYTYEWNFGDGLTSTEDRPNHVYETEGVYTVTVTVTDSLGNLDNAETTVYVASESSGAQIKEVNAGLLISAVISAADEPVDWSISVDGTVFFGGDASGTIPAGTEQTVRLPFTFGFGQVDVVVTANEIQQSYSAFALGPLFLNMQ